MSRLGSTVSPLSFAQERLWLIQAAAPDSATYNVPLFVQWQGRVVPGALRAALDAVIARHEVLRTVYRLQDGAPVQVVRPPVAVEVEVVDLGVAPGAWNSAVEDAAKRARQPFDLAGELPLRAVVWQGVPGGDAVLLLMHHIAIDGWSVAVLFEDLVAAYVQAEAGEQVALPPPGLQYSDFAVWDRATFAEIAASGKVSERALALLEVPGGLDLTGTADQRSRPPVIDGARPGAEHAFPIPAQIWSGVGALARALRATPFVVLSAAFQVVLSRWSGRERFLLGAVTANRPRAEMEELVGFFVNTVPLCCRVDSGQSFRELCAEARTEAFRSLTYQRIPYDQLTAAVSALRGTGRGALVDVGFALQNIPAPRVAPQQRWHSAQFLPTGTAKFDLMLIIEDGQYGHRGPVGTVEYDTSRYDADIARLLGADFLAVLAAVLTDADRSLREVPLPARPARAPRAEVTDPATAGDGADGAETCVPDVVASEPTADQWRAAELFATALAGSGLATVDRRTRRGSPEPPGPEADFFALGGHSLLAVTMLAEAQRRHGVAVSPGRFLADPTVAGLARLLAEGGGARGIAAATADRSERYPATSVQQRFWFLDRIPTLRQAYLLPTVVELTGQVDEQVLCRAAELVLAHHPVLRSRFELDRALRQVHYRTDGPPPAVRRTDACGWEAERLGEHVAQVCWARFDLRRDAPARAEIIACGERSLLVLVAHHIVVDGWARELLVRDIGEAYQALLQGRRPNLTPAVHPADLSDPAGGSATGEHIAAVVSRLRGAPTDARLPWDRGRPELQSTAGRVHTAHLGSELTTGLRTAARTSGASIFMIVAGALAVTLARRSGQRDFLFAFPWVGRQTPQAADAVGMFVNTLVLRVDLRGVRSWPELLDRVRAQAIACYRDAEVPFEAAVSALHGDRDLSRPPLTPVYLSAERRTEPGAAFGEQIRARYLPLDRLHVKYELELTATEHADDGEADIELAVAYAVDLFDAATVTALTDTVIATLAELVAEPGKHPLEGI